MLDYERSLDSSSARALRKRLLRVLEGRVMLRNLSHSSNSLINFTL